MSKAKYRIPAYRVQLVRERRTIQIRDQNAAADAIRHLTCENPTKESFAVLFLDGNTNLIGGIVVGMGGNHGLGITASAVFQPACIIGAAGIIVGHNHPSGSPHPSQSDLNMTRTLVAAGAAIGIPVLDHVIVTECGLSHSFVDHGQL